MWFRMRTGAQSTSMRIGLQSRLDVKCPMRIGFYCEKALTLHIYMYMIESIRDGWLSDASRRTVVGHNLV